MAPQRASWTEAGDRSLLLCVLAASPNLQYNYPTIANLAGLSENQASWRLHILRKEIKALRAKADEKPIQNQSKKRSSPSSDTPTATAPPKKRKLASKKRSRKAKIMEDSSDEASMTTGADEHEATPELEDDNADNSPASIEPETPTKVMPRRKAKREPGSYKQLDEGSELEFGDEDLLE